MVEVSGPEVAVPPAEDDGVAGARVGDEELRLPGRRAEAHVHEVVLPIRREEQRHRQVEAAERLRRHGVLGSDGAA